MGFVLIVVPDAELRQSLQFALEADGHRVEAVATLAEANARSPETDCCILDHHAADYRPGDVDAFYAKFAPVVLLANVSSHPLIARSFATVLKPLLGLPLSLAVTRALSAAG